MSRSKLALLGALLLLSASCTERVCLAGSDECGGTCTRLATDSANCGACGNACPTGAVCSEGVCAATCAAPLATCGTGAAAFCTSLSSDPANCGACGEACTEGRVCDGGECSVTCTGAGSQLCGDRCVDITTDAANCGGCGDACAAGTTCVDGACAPTCPAAQVRCGDRCVDLASDPQNCGACGDACPDFGVCTGGACTAVSCRDGVGLPGVPDLVGPLTFTLASADVDRDGRLDVVVAPAVDVDTPTSTLRVLRNLGGRRFETAPAFSAGLPVEVVRAGDVDGDGIVDLVAGGGGDVTVLRGLAGGGLLPPSAAFEMSMNPFHDLRVVDVSGDGRADVIAAWGLVTVRLGTVSGTLSAPATYGTSAGPFWATSIAVGDLDGDTLPDIVAGQHQTGHFAVFRNLGGGAFAEPVVNWAYWHEVFELALADVDVDGDLDVLAAGRGLVVLLNDGDGTLSAPVAYTTGDGSFIAVGDFDQDGYPDAAVSHFLEPRRVDLFRNAGDGTFLPPEPLSAGGPWALVAADFDGDLRLDLAAASSIANGVDLLWNDGGPFLQPLRSDAPVSPYELLLGDVDGDGSLDAVAWEYSAEAGAILLGDGHGGFSPSEAFEATSLAVGDLDGDGDADVLAGSASDATSPALRVYRSDAGSLVHLQDAAPLASPQLADVDGNGRIDVVGIEGWFSSEARVVWLPGQVGATFGSPVEVGPGSPIQVAVGDLDANGWVDVAGAGLEEALHLWLNTGAGFLHALIPAAARPDGIALGDLDGDGDLDVAYVNHEHDVNVVGALIGGGDGTFVEAAPLPYPSPVHVAIGAPGGRDRNVIFIGGVLGGALGVVELDSTGQLSLVGRWSGAGGYGSLASGDVDGDLRPDVVMGGYASISVRRAACLP